MAIDYSTIAKRHTERVLRRLKGKCCRHLVPRANISRELFGLGAVFVFVVAVVVMFCGVVLGCGDVLRCGVGVWCFLFAVKPVAVVVVVVVVIAGVIVCFIH